MTEKIRILAVLPYEGLREQLQNIVRHETDIELSVIITNLDDAVRDSKKALARHRFDAIISRGGTAEKLRRELQGIEIVDIQVDFFDIFRAVIMARNYTEKFAIQSFPAIATNARRLCSMLQYDIDVYIIHSPEESRDQLTKLKNEGYTMVVGDVTTSQMAKEVGMNVILIMSGDDSIRTAIEQVKLLERVKSAQRRQVEYLHSISRTLPIYMGIYDGDGQLIFTNDEPLAKFPVAGEYIRDHYQKFIEADECEEGLQVKDQFVRINSVKEEDESGETRTIIYGREASLLDAEMTGIVMGDAFERDTDGYAFRSSFGITNAVGEPREAIIKYSNTREPVLILGETGCGKDMAATSMHRLGYNKNRPFYSIDCGAVSSKDWNRFFRHSSSPLMDVNCTIYFRNLQLISPAQEKNLIELIESSNLCHRNQVIFSAVVKAGEENCSMAKYLLEKTSCVMIQAMPLRKRQDDIVSICTMYLAEFNTQTGTQILGLHRDAIEAIKNYAWPGNVTQLKRVLREAVMMTDADYISEETISKCIYNETFDSQEAQFEQINRNQSLEDLTYDIVRLVLKEENMNRQRTADRLKISRTTLWRILKSR